MAGLSELISSIASLMWPACFLVVILLYKREFKEILTRIKKGKFPGVEVELQESLKSLNEKVDNIDQNEDQIFIPFGNYYRNVFDSFLEKTIKNILSEAARSPKLGLMLLSAETESLVRKILANQGLLAGNTLQSLRRSLAELHERGTIPDNLSNSVADFLGIRNKIVHGYSVSNDDILKAIDTGIKILEALYKVPHEVHIIYHPGTEVFKDENGNETIDGVLAVIIESIQPNGKIRTVYPTTKTNYRKGDIVTWEWNMNHVYGQSWYKDPDSQEIRHAWSSSAEFVGNPFERAESIANR